MTAPVEQRHRDEAEEIVDRCWGAELVYRETAKAVAQLLANRDAEIGRLRTVRDLLKNTMAAAFSSGLCFCCTDPGDEPQPHEQWCINLRNAIAATEAKQ